MDPEQEQITNVLVVHLTTTREQWWFDDHSINASDLFTLRVVYGMYGIRISELPYSQEHLQKGRQRSELC
jgi:hypothetical protein